MLRIPVPRQIIVAIVLCATGCSFMLGLVKIRRGDSKSSVNQYFARTSLEAEIDSHFQKAIPVKGSHPLISKLKGAILNNAGIDKNVTHTINTELIYSFSPLVEENFKRTLVDPNHDQIVLGNSPAMFWNGEKYVVVMRMWLDKEKTLGKVQNVFADNYFFMSTFDSKMNPLDTGRVIGITTSIAGNDVGDGPIEPRAFYHYNHPYLSFNTAAWFGKNFVDTTFFWDIEKEQVIIPSITHGNPLLTNTKDTMPRDKHWSPFTWEQHTYFLYSLDPLRILSCDQNFSCHFYHKEGPEDYVFENMKDCLRGGTPTIHYKDDYYITVAHTTLFWKEFDSLFRYYAINLVVLKMGVKPQLVYLSEPIQFAKEFMDSVPMIRKEFIKDHFLFPVSLLLEDDDNIVIGGHVNDHSSYLLRVNGLKGIMDSVAEEQNYTKGVPTGFLHKLSAYYASQQSGYIFTHNLS